MVIQWFSIVMLVYQRVIRLNPLIDSNNNDYVPLPEGSRLIIKITIYVHLWCFNHVDHEDATMTQK